MFAIRLVCLAASAISGCYGALVLTIEEVGNNIIISGDGSLDLAAATILGSHAYVVGQPPLLDPATAGISTWPGTPVSVDAYTWQNLDGPTSFGTGMQSAGTTSTGDFFGFGAGGGFGVPTGYTSGSPLTILATFENSSLESLGLVPGSYTWTWTTGPASDSLTVNIIPEPSTLLLGSLGIAPLVRRRRPV